MVLNGGCRGKSVIALPPRVTQQALHRIELIGTSLPEKKREKEGQREQRGGGPKENLQFSLRSEEY